MNSQFPSHEFKKKTQEVSSLLKENIALSQEKNLLEIEVHSSHKKIIQLQFELGVLSKKNSSNPDIESSKDTLEAKTQEISHLKLQLENSNKELIEANNRLEFQEKLIQKLQTRNEQTAHLLENCSKSLRNHQSMLRNLEEMATKEKRYKEEVKGFLYDFDKGIASELENKLDWQVRTVVLDTMNANDALEIENASLKRDLEDLQAELKLIQEGQGQRPSEILSAIKIRTSMKRGLRTQGTLMLDMNDFFKVEEAGHEDLSHKTLPS